MKKKYYIGGGILAIAVLTMGLMGGWKRQSRLKAHMLEQDDVWLTARTNHEEIQLVTDGTWQDSFLKGVNMGVAKPGYYPGEFGITKKEYQRWFKQIGEMNANVIRVYTLQMPVFYEALYEYNQKAEKPLYLIQGVWLDEETMLDEMDAFSPNVYDAFKEEVTKIVDVLHGNKTVAKEKGKAYGRYKKDVSPYVLGYILGTEWDSYFVEATNEKHQGLADFNGDYIYTEQAQPMEIFFAHILETGIAYESLNYKMQKPAAITNWLTTDSISHSYDVEEANRIGDIDVTHIKAKDSYLAGLFASYHVYPYYPDFLNYDSPYIEPNEQGKINSYEAYLKDLKAQYDIPILVSEVGLPTSRGISHKSETNGFNQGQIDETEQGEMLSSLIKDVYETDYAGAIIFSWQDEWFKRTWNTMNFDDPDGRAYWLDQLTSEQCFGLLAFDPGENEKVAIDGDLSEWETTKPLSQSEKMSLKMQYDEAYLYFSVQYKDLDLSKQKLWIPINVLPDSGAKGYEGTELIFEEGVEFIIQIESEKTGQIVVQDYYDGTKYLEEDFRIQNSESNHFDVISQVINRRADLSTSEDEIPYQKVEIGRLNAGYSSPSHEAYQSLSDFMVKGDSVEIRIPWLMLNISNPAQKFILDDFQKLGQFELTTIKGIDVGVYLITEGVVEYLTFKCYEWSGWERPSYRERLKPAYEVVKKIFADLK